MLRTAVIAAAAVAASSGPPQPSSSPFNFGPGAASGLDSWFSHAQLGLFFHWTPVSQRGWEITYPLLCCPLDDESCSGPPSFTTNRTFPCIITLYPHGQWKKFNSTDPDGKMTVNSQEELVAQRQKYYNLSQTFNPTEFDPSAMAKLAKAAGFRRVSRPCSREGAGCVRPWPLLRFLLVLLCFVF